MKKQKVFKVLLLVFCFCFIKTASAQQANIASGGNAIGTGGTISYSIGQVAYLNSIGSTGSVNQGMQQPFEIVTLGIDNFPEIQVTMSVYPNPTTSLLNLNIQNYSLENLNYQLFDVTGKQIQSQKIKTLETQIQLENLPSAIYLLNVFEDNQVLKTFKIIKNN